MHRVYTRAMHASTSPLDQWMKMYARSQTTLVHSSLARPWGFRLDPGASVAFHLVWKGSAWLRPANELPLQLSERDLVVVGDGQAHELTDTSDGVALPLREFMQLPPAPKEEVETVIFCGRFRISGTRSALGLAALPALLHIPAHELAGQAGVSAVVSLLAGELQAGTAGQETLMESLGESLLIYVLRCAAERAGHSTGWLPAMQDPYLARVFRAIHAEPAGTWTAESMARQGGAVPSCLCPAFLGAGGRDTARLPAGVAADTCGSPALGWQSSAVGAGGGGRVSVGGGFHSRLQGVSRHPTQRFPARDVRHGSKQANAAGAGRGRADPPARPVGPYALRWLSASSRVSAARAAVSIMLVTEE